MAFDLSIVTSIVWTNRRTGTARDEDNTAKQVSIRLLRMDLSCNVDNDYQYRNCSGKERKHVGIGTFRYTTYIFWGEVANRIGNFFAGVILYFLGSVMRRIESWRDWLVLKFSTRRRSLPWTSIGKTVRSCYLMGFAERSGKNFDHRKRQSWNDLASSRRFGQPW